MKLTGKQKYQLEISKCRPRLDLLGRYLAKTLDLDSLNQREVGRLSRDFCAMQGMKRGWINQAIRSELILWLKREQENV